jgi:uncharacterized iron-regulated membrane protein
MSQLRRLHRLIAVVILIPLILITLTGLVLLLRGEFEFIQPKSVPLKLEHQVSLMGLQELTERFQDQSVDQIIWRPQKNSLVVRLQNADEIHLHPQTGEVLKTARRRTNFLIELHQGSWLGMFGQYGVHFLCGLGLLFLIISGVLIYPFKRKNV